MVNKNSEKEAIKNWQMFLISQGFIIQRTMEFDEATEEATKEFQKREQLKVDGIVGAKTLSRVMDIQLEPIAETHK